jgi:phosphomannomutase
MKPVNLGPIPTPALTLFAVSRGKGSIMVTGSHIPFDRNGYKTNTSIGELLKEHEAPIAESVASVRRQLYEKPFEESLFDRSGMLKQNVELPAPDGTAQDEYIARYTDFFQGASLAGMRVLVYQHSAVGRDLLVTLLQRLGAEVIPAGRSDEFVPIDTENIDTAQLAEIQGLVSQFATPAVPLNAVVSFDGDSDRPLVLGVDPASNQVRFFGGDLVGMIAAAYLEPDAVVVPISCNDAIDRGPLARIVQEKTRIGSPYVIAGMMEARRVGKRAICGWEANGGFLLGSDFVREGRILRALPTRDAAVPILCVLLSAREKGISLIDLFEELPRRFSRAALLKNFPREKGLALVKSLAPESGSTPGAIRERLQRHFTFDKGFGEIEHLNYTDGVRIRFDNGEIAHIRPSGNADELRIYAVADSQARADEIVALGTATPSGILLSLAAEIAS